MIILDSDMFRVIDDNGRDIVILTHDVKNLIDIWKDSSVYHKEVRALTKRLEVKNIRCGL